MPKERKTSLPPYTIDGETHTYTVWARICGLPEYKVRDRLKAGMSIEDALSDKDLRLTIGEIEVDGEKHSSQRWAEILGISEATLRSRMQRRTPEEAIRMSFNERSMANNSRSAMGIVYMEERKLHRQCKMWRHYMVHHKIRPGSFPAEGFQRFYIFDPPAPIDEIGKHVHGVVWYDRQLDFKEQIKYGMSRGFEVK